MERGGGVADHAREEVREETLGVAQERATGLDAPKLLEQGEGQNLGVREPLEGLVASGAGIEEAVGVVGEAEQHGQRLFRAGEAWGKVGVGHLLLLVEGSPMALLLPPIHATLI